MGMNIILPIIMGIMLMVSVGSQVAPSFIEQKKIAKVENRTIANQNMIKDAIVRYIKMEGKAPLSLEELKTYGLLKDYHESNSFGGVYDFDIDMENGTLKIFTTIDDKDAEKYFANSVNSPNKPTCVEATGEVCNKWETSYFLDNIIFDILNGISKEETIENKNTYAYIDQAFTEDNVGKKEYYVENPPKNGDKDYVVDLFYKKIIEYEYDGEKWNEKTTLTNFGIGPAMGVEIKNDKFGNEKIFCNAISIEKEVFVVNQNTGLLELIWVAPNKTLSIKSKIFNRNITSHSTNISTDAIYKPNNICTSNLIDASNTFYVARNFNQPLNRWDLSNATSTSWLFGGASVFNQDLSSWDVSNVTNMTGMFSSAKEFNQDLSSWDVSNVTEMSHMFIGASVFNQNLSSWCVSKINYEPEYFYPSASPLSFKPIWGTCPNL